MSAIRPPAPPELQPDSFAFTPENMARAREIIAKYPEGRQQSAMLPLLDLAQRQSGNWLPRAAMDYVADMLETPRIRAYEVASFYTMFNRAPVGRHFVQVCTTTPCWLCGSNDVLRALKDATGARPGRDSDDGQFTVVEVECSGACVNAPIIMINDDYYEDLDYDRTLALIENLKAGRPVRPGSQTGRQGSQAQAGPTSMLDQRPAQMAGDAKPDAAPFGKGAAPARPEEKAGSTVDPETVAEALRDPDATRRDAAPQKRARAATKVQPPGDSETGSDPLDAPKRGAAGGEGVVENKDG